MGDPLNVRLTGIVINQPDLPWWAVGVLNWLGMVHAIQQSSGDIGRTYGGLLKMALDGTKDATPYVNTKTAKTSWLSGPSAVYGIYQQFIGALEREANK